MSRRHLYNELPVEWCHTRNKKNLGGAAERIDVDHKQRQAPASDGKDKSTTEGLCVCVRRMLGCMVPPLRHCFRNCSRNRMFSFLRPHWISLRTDRKRMSTVRIIRPWSYSSKLGLIHVGVVVLHLKPLCMFLVQMQLLNKNRAPPKRFCCCHKDSVRDIHLLDKLLVRERL